VFKEVKKLTATIDITCGLAETVSSKVRALDITRVRSEGYGLWASADVEQVVAHSMVAWTGSIVLGDEEGVGRDRGQGLHRWRASCHGAGGL